MATSTCPKCPNDTFEVKEAGAASTAMGGTYTIKFVQCARCGAAIGVYQPELAADVAKILAKVHRG